MPRKRTPKTVNLALQGGGSHGAFAWGILDKLLEDGRIDVEGICACSAGTMNALALAQGLDSGGRDGARAELETFWRRVSDTSTRFSPLGKLSRLQLFPNRLSSALSFFLVDSATRLLSPYHLNPLDLNPLRDLLAETIDFERLRSSKNLKLFISATHVRSGRVRVFNTQDITIDVALASACLPYLFKAVEIEGEHYWDGGYMGNPSLYPLFYKTKSRDIMIVHINPLTRNELPKSAPDIFNRINEISFNASLVHDMRAIAFVKKLLDQDMLKEEHRNHFKNILLHSIRSDEAMCDLGVASKLKTDWEFLANLRDRGRQTMEQWLSRHYKDINVRDSVDLHTEFLASVTDLFEHKNKHPVGSQ